jgi:hypothetical protein
MSSTHDITSFFSSRLCFKSLKRLLYDCQCLLTHVYLLCMNKVHRWKFFYCLRDFLWQFTQAYLSVKWVINLSPHVQLLFLSSLTSSLTTFVCEIFLDWICQHWLSYDKLSSNINNNNNVSVIQICVWSWQLTEPSFFTMHMLLSSFLYVDVDSVLFVDQQQLTQYTHFSQTRVICAADVKFCSYSNISHWIRWELIIHCTSMQSWFRVKMCWFLLIASTVRHTVWHSFEMSSYIKTFQWVLHNCKWCDHAACCFICNNDILIVILNDENNNNVNGWACCSVKTNHMTLLMRGSCHLCHLLNTYNSSFFFMLCLFVHTDCVWHL